MLLIIRGTQMKATRRYQVTSVRIVGLQTHVLQDGEKRVPGGMVSKRLHWKQFGDRQILQHGTTMLSSNPTSDNIVKDCEPVWAHRHISAIPALSGRSTPVLVIQSCGGVQGRNQGYMVRLYLTKSKHNKQKVKEKGGEKLIHVLEKSLYFQN